MEDSNHLAPYLNTIHTFLTKDAKTQTFPNLTMSMEDVLARIVDDTDFLKRGVDDECKSVAAKIIAQLVKNKYMFTLSYKFESDENGKRVMVYKKNPVTAFKEPEAIKPLRKPNCVKASNTIDITTKTVMSTFKIVCLNATLKFVKNENQMTLQYPDITTEQSVFIKHMIAQCLNPTDFHSETGFKGLYDPLTEALKILSLKYEFQLTDNTPPGSDVKKLTFVKKLKPDRNIETKNLDTTTDKDKKLKQMQPLIQTIRKIDDTFVKDAILKIRDFISNRDSDSVIFMDVSAHEMMFLSQWNTVVNRLEVIQMFSVDVQMALDVIRYEIKRASGVYKLRVTTEVCQVRNVTFMKVYSQKPNRLPKPQSEPHSHSAQDIKPNSAQDTHSTQDIKPNSTQEIKPHSTQDIKPNSTQDIKPNSTQDIKPNSTQDIKPNSTQDIKPNSTQDIKPNSTQDIKPNSTQDIKPNSTQDIKLNSTQDIKPNSTQDIKPQSTQDIKPNFTQDIKPNFTQDIKPNFTQDIKPHSIQDIKPHSTQVSEVPESTQVIEISDSDEESHELRTPSISSSCSSKSVTKNTRRKIEQFLIKAKNIPVKWIRTHLSRIKDFINSDQRILVVPDDSEYCFFLRRYMSWLSLSEVLAEFSKEIQELLKSVQRAVLTNERKFSVKVKYWQEKNGGDKKLTFTKISKTKQDKPVSKKSLNPNKPSEGLNSDRTSTNLPSDVPVIDRVLYDKQKLPAAWIRTTLLKIKAFIQTESEASLVITNVNKPEKSFISKYLTWLYRSDSVYSFSDDLKNLVMDLQRVTDSKSFSVQGQVLKKPNKSSQSGPDFLFTKVPRYPSLGPLAKKVELNNNENTAHNLQSRKTPEYIVSKHVPCKIEPQVSLNKGDNKAAKDATSQKVRSASATRGVNIQKDNSIKSERNTLKKSLSVTSLDKCRTMNRKNAYVVTNNMPQAKVKLIEALNQPLVSEKGLRMMRMMGWEGGALGARGEGIVEPITLPLDLARRAGLGAGKVTKQSTVPVTTNLPVNIVRVVVPHVPNKQEFITGVVGILHKMTTSQMATELVLPNQMTQKNWSFVRQLIFQLNQSSNISLDSTLLDLVDEIQECLGKCGYILNALWGVTRKNILFILSKGIYQASDLDPKDWYAVANIYNDDKKINSKAQTDVRDYTQTNMQDDTQANIQEAVMVPGDAFRYYVLSVILDFCLMSNVTIDKMPSNKPIVKDIMLKGSMALKQRKYIKEIIRRANARSRAASDSDNERILFEEIAGAVTGFTVDVDFPLFSSDENKPPVYKCIRLYKIFDSKTAPSSQNNSTGKAAKISVKQIQAINKMVSANESPAPDKRQKKTDKATEIVDPKVQDIVKNNKTHEIQEKISKIVVKTQVTAENISTRKTSLNPTSETHKRTHEDKIQNLTHKEPTDSRIESTNSENATDEQNELTDDRVKSTDCQNESTVWQDIIDVETAEYLVADCLCCLPDDDISMDGTFVNNDKDKTNEDSEDNKDNTDKTNVSNDSTQDKNESNDGGKKNNDAKDVKKVDYIFIENVTFKTVSMTKQENTPMEAVNEKTNSQGIIDTEQIVNGVKIPRKSSDHSPIVEKDAPNEEVKNTDNNLPSPIIDTIDLTKEIDTDNVIKDLELRKRIKSHALSPYRTYKKRKIAEFVKQISIRHKDHPQVEITPKTAGNIQETILKTIDYIEVLPLLQCHGIQDGGLVYSCHSEKSLILLQKVAQSLDLKIESVKAKEQRHKMVFKINSFITEEVDLILSRFETFNLTLDTKEWLIIKKEQTSEFIVVYVEIDEASYKVIENEKFILYAGIDVARFSFVYN